MKSRDFCFWLQGFLEVSKATTMDAEQVTIMKNHLNMVFKHEIDPSMPDPTGVLTDAHTPGRPPGETLLRC